MRLSAILNSPPLLLLRPATCTPMCRHPRSFDRSTDDSSIATYNAAPNRSFTHHRRDFNIGQLSQTTSIIIIACAGLAGVLLVLAVSRLVSRSASRSRSAPLPPRQELAHRREHQLARRARDESTYAFDSARLKVDSGIASSSTASLIPTAPSLATQDASGSEQEAGLFSPPAVYGYPRRPFSDVPSSAGSLSSDLSPLPSPRIPSVGSLREASPSRRVSRISASGLSSHNSHRAPTSRSNHRSPSSRFSGTPHGPHSNVQIVLPAPLAPQVYQHMVGAEDSRGRPISQAESSIRLAAMADPWVGATTGITGVRQSPQQRASVRKGQRSASSTCCSIVRSLDY